MYKRSIILERVCIIFQNLSGSKLFYDVNLIHLFWLDDLCISQYVADKLFVIGRLNI